MKVVDILEPNAVITPLKGTSRDEILQELSTCLANVHQELNAEHIYDVLLSREKLNSTGIGDGIAVPHGRVNGLDKVKGALGLSPEGIPFGDSEEERTHIFFVLLAPHKPVGAHLKALARVCRLLKCTDLAKRLITLETSSAIYQTLSEKDAQL
ncbi:MAG TPA: PTS fructose transporter subunit IIA [Myxococcales bacterium]|nr:PTS fructose transporter subunit IIA [Myxococcales bacterium]